MGQKACVRMAATRACAGSRTGTACQWQIVAVDMPSTDAGREEGARSNAGTDSVVKRDTIRATGYDGIGSHS